MESFQRGEEVAYDAPAEEEVKAAEVAKPPAPVPEKAPAKPATPAPIKPKSQPIRAKAKAFAPAKTAPKPKTQPAAAVSKLTSLSSSSSTAKQAKQEAAQAALDKSTAAALFDEAQPVQKGTPKVECGCFGNKHKALANCLHCGRVSCIKEGYDFCPYCEFLVQPVQVPEEGMYVQHKIKLLFRLPLYYHSLYLCVSRFSLSLLLFVFFNFKVPKPGLVKNDYSNTTEKVQSGLSYWMIRPITLTAKTRRG